MICKDFQANLDLYVDRELPARDFSDAKAHAEACPTCEALVTERQKLGVLLSTAVTDRVTAVDVCGLWDAIEQDLDAAPASSPFGHPAAHTPPSEPVGESMGWPARIGRMLGFGGEETGWSWSPQTAGAFVMAAAAVALVAVFQGTDPNLEPTVATVASLVPIPSNIDQTPSQEPAKLVRARERSVRIDAMEVGSGHTVQTWMRPKSRTRVIWIDSAFGAEDADSNFGNGFGVQNLSLDH